MTQQQLAPNPQPADEAWDRLDKYPLFLNRGVSHMHLLEWVSVDNPRHLVLHHALDNGVKQVADFVAIGRLRKGRFSFKFLPQGELAAGASLGQKSFAKIAASAELDSPDLHDSAGGINLKTTWSTVTDNIATIVEGARTKVEEGGFAIPFYTFSTGDCLRIKHKLFRERDASELDSNDEQSDTDDDDDGVAITVKRYGSAFDIRQWPVGNTWRTELDQIVDTHQVIPIPAYDTEGQPIAPSRYRTDMEGALVEMHFNIEVWRFTRKDNEGKEYIEKEAITAYLTRLDILSPKRSEQPTSPMRPRAPAKRRTSPPSSPTKRTKTRESTVADSE